MLNKQWRVRTNSPVMTVTHTPHNIMLGLQTQAVLFMNYKPCLAFAFPNELFIAIRLETVQCKQTQNLMIRFHANKELAAKPKRIIMQLQMPTNVGPKGKSQKGCDEGAFTGHDGAFPTARSRRSPPKGVEPKGTSRKGRAKGAFTGPGGSCPTVCSTVSPQSQIL